MSNPIHLHANRLNRNINILFLLIPSIVFVLILYLLLSRLQNLNQIEQVATKQEANTLGEETLLDNDTQNLTK